MRWMAGLLLLGFLSPALAQTSTVQPFGNGYIINTPGRAPTVVQRFGDGYIANTPGQLPTTIQPLETAQSSIPRPAPNYSTAIWERLDL